MSLDRYKNGKIYKLVNNVDKEIYVGSTCSPLEKRKYWHKIKANSNKKIKAYAHFNGIGWDNVGIVLLEECPCKNKMELFKRERYWIDQLKPNLNMRIPLRTWEEYYKINKNKIKNRSKRWYENNRERAKKYNEEYRKKNKEKISQKAKEFYKQNKEIINQKRNVKVQCGCGSTFAKQHLRRHEKSKKHLAWLKQNEN